jgi:hypothetical protein
MQVPTMTIPIRLDCDYTPAGTAAAASAASASAGGGGAEEPLVRIVRFDDTVT